MNRDLSRRLSRVERDHRLAPPSAIFADRPMAYGEGADLLERWQEIVSRGEGLVSGSCLVLTGPVEMTAEAWAARYCPVTATVR